MRPPPSGDWSVFPQICAEHWDACQRAQPRYQSASYDGLVAKRLAWGHPAKRGYVADRCLQWGQGTQRVALSCQSSLGLRCAKVHVENWGSQVSPMLHEGGISRHIIRTVPAMCRTTFSQHAAVVLSAFMRCGVQCLDDCESAVRGQALRGGSIPVRQPHGRHGQSHPPRHGIATSGGEDGQGERWEPLPAWPYDLRRRTWPWHVMSRVRTTLETEAINRLVDTCCRTSPNGLVTHGHQGKVPSPSQSVARSVATYGVSPPISVRRIDPDDGERVTDHYRSHRTERMEHETVDVATFSGRLVPHTRRKGCQRIRSDGVPATQTFATGKVAMQAAVAKVEGVVKGAVQIMARLTSRPRYEPSTGRAPCICPHCQSERGRWRIGPPAYGVISDAGEVIQRGTYTSSAPRAGP